jgi:hypothetical protein
MSDETGPTQLVVLDGFRADDMRPVPGSSRTWRGDPGFMRTIRFDRLRDFMLDVRGDDYMGKQLRNR